MCSKVRVLKKTITANTTNRRCPSWPQNMFTGAIGGLHLNAREKAQQVPAHRRMAAFGCQGAHTKLLDVAGIAAEELAGWREATDPHTT